MRGMVGLQPGASLSGERGTGNTREGIWGLPIAVGSGPYVAQETGLYQVFVQGGYPDFYQTLGSNPGSIAARQVRMVKGVPAFTATFSGGTSGGSASNTGYTAQAAFADGRVLVGNGGAKYADDGGGGSMLSYGGAPATGGDENGGPIRGVTLNFVTRNPNDTTSGSGAIVIIKIGD